MQHYNCATIMPTHKRKGRDSLNPNNYRIRCFSQYFSISCAIIVSATCMSPPSKDTKYESIYLAWICSSASSLHQFTTGKVCTIWNQIKSTVPSWDMTILDPSSSLAVTETSNTEQNLHLYMALSQHIACMHLTYPLSYIDRLKIHMAIVCL